MSKTTVISFSRENPKPKSVSEVTIPATRTLELELLGYRTLFPVIIPPLRNVRVRSPHLERASENLEAKLANTQLVPTLLAPYTLKHGFPEDRMVIATDWFGIFVDRFYGNEYKPIPVLTCWEDFTSLTPEQSSAYLRAYLESHNGVSLSDLLLFPKNIATLVSNKELSLESRMWLRTALLFDYVLSNSSKVDPLQPTWILNEKTLSALDLENHILIKYGNDYFDNRGYMRDLARGAYKGKVIESLNAVLAGCSTINSSVVANELTGEDLLFIQDVSKTVVKNASVHAEPKRGDVRITAFTPEQVIEGLSTIEDLMTDCDRIFYLNTRMHTLRDEHYSESYQAVEDVKQVAEASGSLKTALSSTNPVLKSRINRDLGGCYWNALLPTKSESLFLAELLGGQQFHFEGSVKVRYPHDKLGTTGAVSPKQYESNVKYVARSSTRSTLRSMLSVAIDNVCNALSYANYPESGAKSSWDLAIAKYFKTDENFKKFLEAQKVLRELEEFIVDFQNKLTVIAPSDDVSGDYTLALERIEQSIGGDVNNINAGVDSLPDTKGTLDLLRL